MRIAVASGKGGTGKTTVALGLARAFGSPVQLLDCDVEEPNVGLFLKGEVEGRQEVAIPVPVVDESLCDGCGACAEICQFNAIVVARDKPLVFADLCHGCGGCARVCPRGAIREEPRRIGVVETARMGDILRFEGRLDVGRANVPPLIRAVRARMRAELPAILDAPPGTSCPVIAAVRDTDVVVLVTEPTAFGLHDLSLAVETMRILGLPCGVVVNRMGVGDRRVHAYCEREGLPILAEIPDDRRVAEAYSRGELMVDALPGYRPLFEQLLAKTRRLADAPLEGGRRLAMEGVS
ncbi:MAG: ATP-binding protein [Deltaproteobacteria bacterium]|nr:ATP-binding protein [Deltaproteobacteria bacterium]